MSTKKIPIAIQLYSVRDAASKDVAGTLKQLAAMGYAGVEFAGTYDLPAAELRGMLDENGLKCAGAHVPLPALEGDALSQTVAIYKTLGTDRLIIPHANMDQLDDILPRMKAAQAAATALGVNVGFHNHAAEFESVNGVTHFDRIFTEIPTHFLVQVDIGWVAAAGQDIFALLKKYANRIETVHIKEFDADQPTAVVGEGRVEWPPILDFLATETRVEWFVVEQERYRVDSLDSARGCIENLKQMGWQP